MSIKLDWDLTDAPAGDEKHPHSLPATIAPNLSSRHSAQDAAAPAPERPHRRWPIWVAVVSVLGLAAGVSSWVVTRTGWQQVTSEVAALVHYEEGATLRGQASLVMAVQDTNNTDWLALRLDQLDQQQPAPLPLPMLQSTGGQIDIASLEAVETDVIMAIVGREFETSGGEMLSFRLPQFYRRSGASDWRRSAPPGQFWGQWLSWESPHLLIRYSERDADFVAQAAPALEMQLALACASWQDACFNVPPAHLYLSGFVGSIGYDPLSNVEVRISLGPNSADTADYYLSVPSPQIAGIPQDEAGEKLLTDYLAVRLIASMAQHATRETGAYQTLTVGAINTLGLGYADPGYVAAARDQIDNGPSGGQATSSTMPLLLGPQRYQVVAGDTLSSIASHFRTTVDAIVLQNNLADPDRIQIDTWLTIPVDRPPQP
jgi:LysM repeat protein